MYSTCESVSLSQTRKRQRSRSSCSYSSSACLLTLLIVPILLVMLEQNGAASHPSVRRVTAYYDPFWKTRTKRTTSQVPVSSIRTAAIEQEVPATTALPEIPQDPVAEFISLDGGLVTSSHTKYGYFVPEAVTEEELYPTTAAAPEFTTDSLPESTRGPRSYTHRKRYRVIPGGKTYVQRKRSTVPTEPPSSSAPATGRPIDANTTRTEIRPRGRSIRMSSLETTMPQPVASTTPVRNGQQRRRRLTHHRFHTGQHNASDQAFTPSQDQEPQASSYDPQFTRWQPLETEEGNGPSSKYQSSFTSIVQEGLSHQKPRFKPQQKPTSDQFWDMMTQSFPKVILESEPEIATELPVRTMTGNERQRRPSSSSNYMFEIGQDSRNSIPTSSEASLSEEEGDLELSESINPFLNSSTPISNDLKNHFVYSLDLLHPLLNADSNFHDVAKIPEDKTVAIKHKLSDQSVGVKVAPDLYRDLEKSHFMLNPDGILLSDYERQVHKTKPQVQVKHSVSVSTSTTISTSHSDKKTSKRPKISTTTPVPATQFEQDIRVSKENSNSGISSINLPILPSSAVNRGRVTKNSISIPSTTTSTSTSKPITKLTILSSTTPRPHISMSSTSAAGYTTSSEPTYVTLTRVKAASPSPSIMKHSSSSTTSSSTAASQPGSSTPTATKPLFTLRPKVYTTLPTIPTTTRKSVPITTTAETTTSARTTTIPTTTQKPEASSNSINTFLDNVDEENGKNRWSPPPSTTKTTTTTPVPETKPTEKIQPNKDPPLILMPPFTNDKEQPSPVTLTTTVTTEKPPTQLISNAKIPTNPKELEEAILLQQLLGFVGGQPTAIQPQPTTKKTTTTRKPTTPRPQTTQADLLNLLNLFGGNQNQPQQRPTQAPPPATSNDLLNLLNLFQPPTTPRPAATQSNGLLNLFNIFQPQPTTPAPGLGNLFGIFNLFQPTTTPRPANNDLFGLFNLFQPQTTRAPIRQTVPTTRRPVTTANPQSALDALVQQALLESLGANAGAVGNNQLNTQATTATGQRAIAEKENTASKSNTLTDSDLKSIFEILDQQSNGPPSTRPQTTPAPTPSTRSTTTLMPIFRNVLNLFGITDPPLGAASSEKAVTAQPPGPVYNPLSTTPAPNIQKPSNEDLMLQIINSNGNSGKELPVSTTSTTTTTTPAPTTPPVPTVPLPNTPAESLDLLSQLLNLGQVVQNTQVSTTQAPSPSIAAPPLDIQTILAQSWLNQQQAQQQAQQRPEIAPSESNLLQLFANQFTPKPEKPSGLYYWVDLNAFMGDQQNNPNPGIRPKLGHKDYFLKLYKRNQ